MEKKVKCTNCGWVGDEDQLMFVEDVSFVENSMDACPKCQTDEYLMDIDVEGKEVEENNRAD